MNTKILEFFQNSRNKKNSRIFFLEEHKKKCKKKHLKFAKTAWKAQYPHKMGFLWSWHQRVENTFFWGSRWQILMLFLKPISWAIQRTKFQRPTPQGSGVMGCLLLPTHPNTILSPNVYSYRSCYRLWSSLTGSKLGIEGERRKMSTNLFDAYFTGFNMAYVRDHNATHS